MWRKRKDIEGISSSSIVTLKALVSEEEQKSKRTKLDHAKQTKLSEKLKPKQSQMNKRNTGVEERQQKDEASYISDQEKHNLQNVEKRLTAKTELYNRMGNLFRFFRVKRNLFF